MKIVDANIILRILMEDNEDLLEKALQIIQDSKILILNEVIAEVIYVLEKFYKIERIEIKNGLFEFFENDNIELEKERIVKTALILFAEKNLDFVDCILYSYNVENKYEIATFDKKLLKVIKNSNIGE